MVCTVATMSSVAKAMCCTPEPKYSERKRDDRVRWLCEPFSTMRSAPSAVWITWLRTTPPGSLMSSCGVFVTSSSDV